MKKFPYTSLLGIPFVGVLLLLGAVANQSKPVLSNQVAYIDSFTVSATNSSQLPTYTWLQKNSYPASEFSGDKEARLRKVLAKSSVSAPTAVTHSNDLEAVSTTKVTAAQLQAPTKTATVTSRGTTGVFPKQDGVYLYGQSPKSGQLGQGYIIFEKQQGKVMGALYMPSSEFSCFNGTLQSSGQLAMTVTGYPGDKSPTQVATNNTLPQTMDDESSSYAHSVTLQDYYPINNISADDRRILQMCQANVQQ
ncbi:hypothetical protein [Brasilonema sp. UFV-L1]|uniref:hypothetical protein n=1 Tax=Brasilonema sp. UFV-L1 TaxID=2234130 RepID=UPI00145E84DD|nr:hypothetical protein [Brasilonema sp. UFV-L1]NMG10248.1 hypothetical protein [Brasilonema sp. UFV-L1]